MVIGGNITTNINETYNGNKVMAAYGLQDKMYDYFENADRIAVINEGELVELGTHEELMNIDDGQYKTLYEMQFKKQEEKSLAVN